MSVLLTCWIDTLFVKYAPWKAFNLQQRNRRTLKYCQGWPVQMFSVAAVVFIFSMLLNLNMSPRQLSLSLFPNSTCRFSLDILESNNCNSFLLKSLAWKITPNSVLSASLQRPCQVYSDSPSLTMLSPSSICLCGSLALCKEQWQIFKPPLLFKLLHQVPSQLHTPAHPRS